MYLHHFHLQEPPFSIAPNPRYLYLGKRHQEALAHLIFGLRGEGGIVVLTGEVGTGKTTISRKLLEDIPADTCLAWIVNPKLSAEELLATICDELHIDYPPNTQSIKIFTDLLSQALMDAHAHGRNTVLMIDEAQNLSPEVLEQLRLLTNLETNERKLLQIVLLGQDELKDMLARHDMRQLAQRITARYHLHPLTRSETDAYIRHRLGVAGTERPLFRQSAIRDIHRLSRGIPRLINLLCDRSLLGTYAGEKQMVESRHVRQAANEMFGTTAQHRPLRYALIASALAGLLMIALMQSGILFFDHRPPAAIERLSSETTPAIAAMPNTGMDKSSPAQEQAAAKVAGQAAFTWQDIDRLGSRQMAYQTLVHLWRPGVTIAPDQEPCAQVIEHGLKCLQQRGDWGLVKSLNRPAIIRLTDADSDRFAVLTAINKDTATLQLGDRQWQVSLHDLEQHWFGEFTLLWQTPDGFTDTLRPGDNGAAVSWLVSRLDRIQGQLIPTHTSTRMDAVLVSRIKDFQRHHGLHPDGAAGPLTLMQINDTVKAQGPRLMHQGDAG